MIITMGCHKRYVDGFGPSLSKWRGTWTPALWCRYSWFDNRGGNWMTKRRGACTVWITWTKKWFMAWVGRSRAALDFITLLRTVCKLKLMNCVSLEFSHWLFPDHGWPRVTEIAEREMGYRGWGRLLYLFLCSPSVCIYFLLGLFHI